MALSVILMAGGLVVALVAFRFFWKAINGNLNGEPGTFPKFIAGMIVLAISAVILCAALVM